MFAFLGTESSLLPRNLCKPCALDWQGFPYILEQEGEFFKCLANTFIRYCPVKILLVSSVQYQTGVTCSMKTSQQDVSMFDL